MLSIVYSSTTTGTFGDNDLATLLMNSRANNRRIGLTGVLLFKDGHFLQVLEGPEEIVRDRIAIISADPRHDHLTTIVEENISDRQFPTWTMGYETVTDTLAQEIPGYRTTFDDITTSNVSATRTQPAVRQMVQWFHARNTQAA